MAPDAVVEVDVAPYAPRSVLETLPCSFPALPAGADLDFESVATPLVSSLDTLGEDDLSPSSIWRDVFALTGTMRTLYSAESIVRAWSETCKSRQAAAFVIIKGSAHAVRLDEDSGWVNVSFTFRCHAGPATQCRGILSLAPDRQGKWRIWLLRTVLEQLEGTQDVDNLVPVGGRADGVEGTYANGVDGTHAPDRHVRQSPSTLDCIVVGAGQAGLSTAGRLQALGISYLVLEKHAQTGDNWMSRYDSARLHTSREYSHLPFDRTFPLPYQEFLTKNDLAKGYKDWVDKFGIEKNIRFSTALVSGSWDEADKTWTLHVSREGNSTMQTLTCRYLVMAVGGGGQVPIMPTYPGQEEFQGIILHSADYKSADSWQGKAGIVIGTANTAHDVAEDMVEAGLSSITMVQRTRTYVLPYEYFKVISDRSYNADVPTVDADREGYTMPYAVTRLLSHKALHGMAAREPERFDALESAGFKVERYGDIMYHICVKLGGHYMDVGCSDMIAKGLIKMKTGALPTHYTRTGLVFSDGTEVAADVIVFSTGFVGNVRTDVARIFGKDVASRADDFWGLDEEGELKGVFKKNSHPHMFYIGGTLGHARYFSRFLAIQIKADLMGVPLEVYDGERRAPHGDGETGGV